MMTRLRSLCSFACLFSLAWFALAVCGHQPASAATDDEVFSTLDANEDGVLSGKEAVFVSQFDADKDGEVTKAEYVAGSVAEHKRLLSIDDDKLFAERDANEDDVLSGKELLGLLKYDADSDGEVSRKEFDQGRAADRRKLAGPNKEEQVRLALEKFRQLDTNEDGRLSGKEMVGFEKLDSNGDRRVSEKEFVAGFSSTPAEPAGDPLSVFLEMIRTSDPTTFLKACDPEYAKKLDRPVLKFFMESVASSLGALEPSAKDALRPMEETIDDKAHTVYLGQLEFKEGKADAGLIVYQNRIVGFRLEPPVLNDVHVRLYSATWTDKEFAKSIIEFYTPRCEEFIRLILGANDDKAFAKFHPDAQNRLGRDKVQNLFEVFRTNCGNFKSIEIETIAVNFDTKGKGVNFELKHLVQGSKRNFLTTTTFQINGLSAHIFGLHVKTTEADPDSPSPKPEKPADLKWVKVPATAEGVTFEMPVKPERSEYSFAEGAPSVKFPDGKIAIYEATTKDKKFKFLVAINTAPRSLEAEAKQILDKEEEHWAAKTPSQELLTANELKAGNHPGRVFSLKLKADPELKFSPGVSSLRGPEFGDSFKNAQFGVVRSAIVGSRMYSLMVMTSETDKARRDEIVRHFFDAAKFIDTDDELSAPPVPPANPDGKAGELKWIPVFAPADGVAFELPAKPKRTVDENKQQVVYRLEAADKSFTWTVIIETAKENRESETDAIISALHQKLYTDMEGEVRIFNVKAFDPGGDLARILCLKVKEDSEFFVERTVIIGPRLYRFQVITSELDQRPREKVFKHFFKSIKFLATDDDVPAPPAPPPPLPPSKTPVKMPKLPPSVPKPPVP